MGHPKTGSITTNDGVRINYLEAGEGPVLLLLPGFRQTAAEFSHQLDELSGHHRVIAMDLRGHGESEKTDHGYRVARFAADLRDLLQALDLRDVAIAAHSLGVTVIWAYIDLFGEDRISRLVFIDQAAIAAADAAPAGQAQALGAIFGAEMAAGIRAGLLGPDPATAWQQVLDLMHTPELSAEDLGGSRRRTRCSRRSTR